MKMQIFQNFIRFTSFSSTEKPRQLASKLEPEIALKSFISSDSAWLLFSPMKCLNKFLSRKQLARVSLQHVTSKCQNTMRELLSSPDKVCNLYQFVVALELIFFTYALSHCYVTVESSRSWNDAGPRSKYASEHWAATCKRWHNTHQSHRHKWLHHHHDTEK